jgi:hypothetical protein
LLNIKLIITKEIKIIYILIYIKIVYSLVMCIA